MLKILRALFLVFLLGFAFEAGAAPPSLVDRLLEALGSKNLQPIEIRPGAGGGAPPSTKASTPKNTAGLELATSFFPVYDLDAAPDASPSDTSAPPKRYLIPFFASGPVATPQKNILSLVIMIPDSDREAARAFAFARGAQDDASIKNPAWYAGDALVIAPQFLNPEDIAANTAQWPDGGASILKWAGAGWIYGADSVSEPSANVMAASQGLSSYEVLDFLLLALARKEMFPDLERVVIAGAGAGGDFVQRYAALGLAPDILAQDGIKLRFVAANAWSYLYMNKLRAQLPDPGVYTAPDDLVFAEPKAESCANDNVYPYGLEALPVYARRQGENAIRLRYDQRVVLYLAGKNATHPLPDNSPQACALVLQGRSLNQRAAVFYQNLQNLYGENLPLSQRFFEVPGLAEEAPPLWRSPCGMSVLFGDGACSAETGDKLKVVQ